MTHIYASESIKPSASGTKRFGEVQVFAGTVEKMVNQVLTVLGNNSGGGHSLTIDGFGAENYHSVGWQGKGDSSGILSLQVDAKGNLKGPAHKQIQRLSGIVSTIRLVQDHNSFDLLLAITKALGAVSRAHTNKSLVVYYGPHKPVRRKKVAVKDVHVVEGKLLDQLWQREGGKTIIVEQSAHPHSTLSGVARTEYGDWKLWPLIYDLNRIEIGRNPNRLKIGQRLRILPKQRFTPQQIIAAKKRAATWRHF